MLRALSGGRPDVLPAAPCYLGLFLAELERSHYIEQYRRRLAGGSRYPVDHEEDTLFRAQALYRSYGVFREPSDWLEVQRGASRAWAARTEIVAVNGILYYADKETGHRAPMHAVPMPRGDANLPQANPSLTDLWDTTDRLRSAEDVDRLLPILPAEKLLARGDLDLPRRVAADYGDRYFLSTIVDTPFSDAYDLLGFQGLMLIQHDRTALLHHLLERKLAQSMEAVTAWGKTGIHGLYVEEVFTGADTISPRSYDEFVFAYNRPYFRHLHKAGLLAIHYVCGDALPRLERIGQLEVTAVAVEESKKGFDIEIEEVVRRVGERVVVLGNVDAVHFGLHATKEEMAAEVRRQARAGAAARGFVVSTGSPFPLDTDPRMIDTLVATAHSLPG